jgi:hypothetical protein
MSLNMNKEYQVELRTLRAAERKITSDLRAELRRINKEMAFHKRQFHKLHKDFYRASDRAGKHSARIKKRIAILQGRLS